MNTSRENDGPVPRNSVRPDAQKENLEESSTQVSPPALRPPEEEDDVGVRWWAFSAVAIAVGTVIVVYWAFLNDVGQALVGAQPPTSEAFQTRLSYFSTSMAVDAAILVSVAVAGSTVASRIKTHSRTARWTYYFGFLYIADWVFFALVESYWGLVNAEAVNARYIQTASNNNMAAWLQGFLMVAASMGFAFAPECRMKSGK